MTDQPPEPQPPRLGESLLGRLFRKVSINQGDHAPEETEDRAKSVRSVSSTYATSTTSARSLPNQAVDPPNGLDGSNPGPPPEILPPPRPLTIEPEHTSRLSSAYPSLTAMQGDASDLEENSVPRRHVPLPPQPTAAEPTRIVLPSAPPPPPQVIRVIYRDHDRPIPPTSEPAPPSTYSPPGQNRGANSTAGGTRNQEFRGILPHQLGPSRAFAPSVDNSSDSSRPGRISLDDDKPPRLLCLDGSGGVRGLSSLLLLKEFLYRVAKHKRFTGDPSAKILPCEYFDMICGTGTGGLIAIMLGKLRMTVDEAIEQYLNLSKRIFAKKKWIWKEGRYSARNLELAVKNIVGERALILKLPGYDLPSTSLEDRGKRIMMRESKSDPKLCKVFVCARQVNDSCEEVNIRSYSFDKSQQEDLTIWEAARATTASPYFFKPLRIPAGNGRRVGGVYIDAAVGHNNPIKRLLVEARREFPKIENAFILSLGSGIQDLIHLPHSTRLPSFRYLEALAFLHKVAVDCESVHQDVSKELHKTPYFRLNVDRGVHGISHDAWNQVDAIYQSTMAYTQRGETDNYIDQVVDAFIKLM
ncbi:unnamed protein product [Rhizoctonia solani]|uniref:PNPLA domain-containing protein n=1 Tax=Rhizoctonia solani TaxID=456999 RepID=A0A8H3GLZ0_9AGAM|nr:unnamed protein product [Rhizoctonia solani]